MGRAGFPKGLSGKQLDMTGRGEDKAMKGGDEVLLRPWIQPCLKSIHLGFFSCMRHICPTMVSQTGLDFCHLQQNIPYTFQPPTLLVQRGDME